MSSGSQTRGGTSERDVTSAVAPYAAAVAQATSLMRRTRVARASLSFARMVPSRTAVSGMMLAAVPASNLPTVMTAAAVGSISRAMMASSAR